MQFEPMQNRAFTFYLSVPEGLLESVQSLGLSVGCSRLSSPGKLRPLFFMPRMSYTYLTKTCSGYKVISKKLKWEHNVDCNLTLT